MKAFFLKKTSILLMLIIMIAFSEIKAQSGSCGCPDPNVSAADLDTYVDNYEKIFRTKDLKKKIFTKWIYLPKNYFLFLDSFFSSPEYNSYQGVKFLFVDYNNPIDFDQQAHANQLLFNISAAIDPMHLDKNAFIAFDSKVDYLWNPANGKVYLSPASNVNPEPNTKINKYEILRVNSSAVARHKSNRYSSKYTKEIFVCKDVIKLITNELRNNPSLGGIKCMFGSYNKPMPNCINLKNTRQFTLIFAPVVNQNSIVKFADYFKENKFLGDIFNHGSLCPNDCTQ